MGCDPVLLISSATNQRCDESNGLLGLLDPSLGRCNPTVCYPKVLSASRMDFTSLPLPLTPRCARLTRIPKPPQTLLSFWKRQSLDLPRMTSVAEAHILLVSPLSVLHLPFFRTVASACFAAARFPREVVRASLIDLPTSSS